MRRALAAALGGVAALCFFVGSAGAALEPVSVTAKAPGTVTAGAAFKLEVTVEAESGALDVAAQPLLLGVKLAPECGGSLVGTPGAPVLERTLTVPAGSAFNQTFSAEVTVPGTGTEVLCTFLQDSQERQFATDTEAEVLVQAPTGPGQGGQGGQQPRRCTAAAASLSQVKLDLRRLDRRIAKVRHRMHHFRGAHRKVLLRKLHKLRAKRRKLAKRRLQVATMAKGC